MDKFGKWLSFAKIKSDFASILNDKALQPLFIAVIFKRYVLKIMLSTFTSFAKLKFSGDLTVQLSNFISFSCNNLLTLSEGRFLILKAKNAGLFFFATLLFMESIILWQRLLPT